MADVFFGIILAKIIYFNTKSVSHEITIYIFLKIFYVYLINSQKSKISKALLLVKFNVAVTVKTNNKSTYLEKSGRFPGGAGSSPAKFKFLYVF